MIISILYAIPRLLAIKSFPPFIDELIYVRWAQQGYLDAAKRFVSLGDGKQPLFIWLISLTMNVIHSPLAAGRSVSFAAGFLTMLGIGTVSYLLFTQYSVSALSMLLYALYPFAIVHDRIALYDSLVGTLYIWTIALSILFTRKPTLGKAFLFANLMGAALLVKSTSLIFFLLIPLAGILLSKDERKRNWLPIIFYTILIFVLSMVYASVVHLSVDAAYIGVRDAVSTQKISDVLKLAEATTIVQNLYTMLGWIITYLTIPVTIVAFIPIFFRKLRKRQIWFTVSAFAIPLVIFAVIGKLLFPRLILFFTLPLLILTAYGIVNLPKFGKKMALSMVSLAVVVFSFGFVDFTILHNMAKAAIPDIDRFQFVNGWPAGGGIREVISYLQQEAQHKTIVIATEGDYGSLPKTAAELYFSQMPNIHIISFPDTIMSKVPDDVHWAAQQYTTYIIFNVTQQIPDWPMDKVMEFQKGNANSFLRLYRYSILKQRAMELQKSATPQ